MNKNITATILTALAFGVYFTYTTVKWDEVKAVQAVNDQYSQAIANADNLITTRDKVLQAYNSLSEDDRARIDKMVPNSVDNIRLIIDINSIANRRGIVLRGINAQARMSGAPNGQDMAGSPSGDMPNNIISAPTLDTVSVSFNTSTSYGNFIDFMRDLESSLRIIDLTHMTMAVNDKGGYDFAVQLTTYWLRQQ